MKIYVVAPNHKAFCEYIKEEKLESNSEYIYIGSEHNILGLRLNKETSLLKLKNWTANKSLYFIERIYKLEAFKEQQKP